VILLDTSGLLAAIDAAQHHHERAAAALKAADGPRILSPFVLAELDYLLDTRVSQTAQLELLREVARGAYQLAPFSESDARAPLE
jgi:predicted nucleic acid-binding protein